MSDQKISRGLPHGIVNPSNPQNICSHPFGMVSYSFGKYLSARHAFIHEVSRLLRRTLNIQSLTGSFRNSSDPGNR